jgi:hypothetical protein
MALHKEVRKMQRPGNEPAAANNKTAKNEMQM